MCVCLVRSYEPETSLRLSDSNVFIIVLAEEYKEFLVKQEIYVYMFFKYVTALFFIFFFFFLLKVHRAAGQKSKSGEGYRPAPFHAMCHCYSLI